MPEHEYFMPSGAEIWGNCPAGALALNTMRSPENERSRQGDAAHWLAARLLKSGGPVPSQAPNGVLIDDNVREGVKIYIDDILHRASFSPDSLWIERPLSMHDIHSNCGGTPDVVFIDINTIYIWDYKHGYAEVSPLKNYQLACYLKGVLNAISPPHPKEFVFTIVQPFAYHAEGIVRRWGGRISDVKPIWDKLSKSAHASPTDARAGTHCRYCPAIWKCGARRESDYNYMDALCDPVDFNTMDGRSMAIEYRILKDLRGLIKRRIEAAEDHLRYIIEKGDVTTGLALKAKPGRLEWSRDSEYVIKAMAAIGIDIRKDGCKTPRQAKLGLPPEHREIFHKAIRFLTKRKQSIHLINQSDTLAGRIFGRKEA